MDTLSETEIADALSGLPEDSSVTADDLRREFAALQLDEETEAEVRATTDATTELELGSRQGQITAALQNAMARSNITDAPVAGDAQRVEETGWPAIDPRKANMSPAQKTKFSRRLNDE